MVIFNSYVKLPVEMFFWISPWCPWCFLRYKYKPLSDHIGTAFECVNDHHHCEDDILNLWWTIFFFGWWTCIYKLSWWFSSWWWSLSSPSPWYILILPSCAKGFTGSIYCPEGEMVEKWGTIWLWLTAIAMERSTNAGPMLLIGKSSISIRAMA